MPPAPESSAVDVNPGVIWAKVDALLDGALRMLPNLVIALVVFAGFVGLARLARVLLRRSTRGRRTENVGLVLGRLAQAGVLFTGLLVSVSVVAPSIGGAELLQVLGVGGVAIGFAFRDILQNFVAGLLILLRHPFRVGDQIVYKDFEGSVEAIETRATFLKTYDGTRVIVPNGEIYTNAVRVNTAFEARRTEVTVGIGYGDDPEAAAAAMLGAMRVVDGVLAEPAPDVLVAAFGASTVDLVARWWSKPQRADVLVVRTRVLVAIKRALGEAAIDLPFPTNVVLFHDQTEDADGDRRRQREGWPAGEHPPAPRRLTDELARAARGGAAEGDGSERRPDERPDGRRGGEAPP